MAESVGEVVVNVRFAVETRKSSSNQSRRLHVVALLMDQDPMQVERVRVIRPHPQSLLVDSPRRFPIPYLVGSEAGCEKTTGLRFGWRCHVGMIQSPLGSGEVRRTWNRS